jgi:hypothetical protein
MKQSHTYIQQLKKQLSLFVLCRQSSCITFLELV